VEEIESERVGEPDNQVPKPSPLPRYDEISQLRAELDACQIGRTSLLLILTQMASRQSDWKTRTVTNFVDVLRVTLSAMDESKASLTKAYWNSYRYGILRSTQIDNMVGDSTIQGALPVMELAPRGIVFLEEVCLSVA